MEKIENIVKLITRMIKTNKMIKLKKTLRIKKIALKNWMISPMKIQAKILMIKSK